MAHIAQIERRKNAGPGLALALAAALACTAASAQTGTVTGLPLPRYASLKTDRVNLREGPSKDHATKWVFQRAGLPVEITAEFATWRKVRDSEGAEGWVLHTLLSGRRTALVGAVKKEPTYNVTSGPSDKSDVVAQLQAGVIVNLKRCDGAWCLVYGQGYKGYVRQIDLWGVYPDEKVE
jgi:SH3-like domain-containing protein